MLKHSDLTPRTSTYGSRRVDHYEDADGHWLADATQVAAAFDRHRVTIHLHLKNHAADLIEGEDWHWADKNRGPRYRLWTKDGFLKLARLVRGADSLALAEAMTGEPASRPPRRRGAAPEYCRVVLSAVAGVVPCYYQYHVASYRVDLYFPTLDLAVDIGGSVPPASRSAEALVREDAVRSELGCDLLRFDPGADGMNPGVVVNHVLKTLARRFGKFSDGT